MSEISSKLESTEGNQRIINFGENINLSFFVLLKCYHESENGVSSIDFPLRFWRIEQDDSQLLL